jgi:threonine/homoserine/homoserine lactone efflux protein
MPDLGFLWRGLILGFSIAAPVGPIGVLCIRRTLTDGPRSGLATGLGAAAADGIYGAIAAFGLSWLTAVLVGQQRWIRLIGGLFLLVLGLRTVFARPAATSAETTGTGLTGAFGSTFVLTLTNPMTILSFVAVFAGLGLGAGATGPVAAGLLVAGVVAGSAAWWLLLSGAVGALRGRFDQHGLRWVNRVSGVVIAAFGVLALAGLAGEGP